MRWLGLVAIAAAMAGGAAAQTTDTQDDKFVGEGTVTDVFRVAGENSCINGHNPFAENTTARIRGLSEQTLATYLSLAGSSSGVNVRPIYTTKRHTLGWGTSSYETKEIAIGWTLDGVASDLNSVNDPLARLIAESGHKPQDALRLETFLVSGVKMTAMGTWRIVNPSDPDKTLGRYRIRFLRENSLGGQAWTLLSVEVFANPDTPAEVTQYCAEPGDVQRNQARLRAEHEERERKRMERAQRRAAN